MNVDAVYGANQSTFWCVMRFILKCCQQKVKTFQSEVAALTASF